MDGFNFEDIYGSQANKDSETSNINPDEVNDVDMYSEKDGFNDNIDEDDDLLDDVDNLENDYYEDDYYDDYDPID